MEYGVKNGVILSWVEWRMEYFWVRQIVQKGWKIGSSFTFSSLVCSKFSGKFAHPIYLQCMYMLLTRAVYWQEPYIRHLSMATDKSRIYGSCQTRLTRAVYFISCAAVPLLKEKWNRDNRAVPIKHRSRKPVLLNTSQTTAPQACAESKCISHYVAASGITSISLTHLL